MKERGWQNIIILFKLIIHSKIKIEDLANKTLRNQCLWENGIKHYVHERIYNICSCHHKISNSMLVHGVERCT